MKRFLTLALAICTLALATGCTRIATGEVGLRVDMNRQTLPGELMPGSWNQTLFGDVLEFPVRDVPLGISDAHPITKDNTALGDFDMTAAYSIAETCVSDLWTKKSRTFHGAHDGHYLLMQNFVQNTLNTATWKAVKQYDALSITDKQTALQEDIQKLVDAEMKLVGYDNCLHINSIQVKSAVPSAELLASAKNAANKANELKAKEAEVAIAEAENRRLAALAGSAANQHVMELENQRIIALAIREGKVNTIMIPTTLTALGSFGK